MSVIYPKAPFTHSNVSLNYSSRLERLQSERTGILILHVYTQSGAVRSLGSHSDPLSALGSATAVPS